jgi:hypothetical protein
MPEEEYIVDAESTEIVRVEPVPSQTMTLFGTDDPVGMIEAATRSAEALAGVLEKQRLFKDIKGKRHVLVEGWTLLGSMLGVFPVCVWTHKLEDGWEARVEARTRNGDVVGAAEAECLRSEPRWKNADDYAIRSMAQTRATSKALRQPLGFVVELAGFNATPAEEMPSTANEPQRGSAPKPKQLTLEEALAELRQRQSRLVRIDPDNWKKDVIFDVVSKATGEEIKNWEDLPKEWVGSLLRQARHAASGIEESLQIDPEEKLEELPDPPDPEAEAIPFGDDVVPAEYDN